MELIHMHQINPDMLCLEKMDGFITACDFQERCTHLAQTYLIQARKKIAIVNENPNPGSSVTKHLEIFRKSGFELLHVSKDISEVIDDIMNRLCNLKSSHLNFVVDYSCMPKQWYSAIIDNITRNNYPPDRINLFLSYTPKRFSDIAGKQKISYLGPVLAERDKLLNKRPVAMIVALDNNKELINEAVNKVNPQKVLAFMPNCDHDPEYQHKVMQNNQSLLKRLSSTQIVHYNVSRPEEIESMLASHCLNHRLTSEVMILPQGPKTFSMMSRLIAVKYPDVKLWEIIIRDSGNNSGNEFPAGKPVLIKVSFLNDDIEID